MGASILAEKGLHVDWGWGILFQPGRHRCVLAGVVSGRPEDDAEEHTPWTACAAWAGFEPVVGQAKRHEETLLFPDVCTHFFEGNEQTLHDLSSTAV
jgi:hypothetical protein